MIIKKLNRRMRCSYCHTMAIYGIGKKGNDFFLCENHFADLLSGMEELAASMAERPVEGSIEALLSPVKGHEEETEQAVEDAKKTENAAYYYICPHCGVKFSKRKFTKIQFAKHVGECKIKAANKE